jgi:hypothetical protein
MYEKSNHIPFFGKNVSAKLIGSVKGLARVLDEPLVQSGVALLAPELGAGLAVAKRVGLLEKLKK